MPTAETAAATRTFEDLSHDDVDFAGGKGANLGELTAAGLPVPGGFVLGAPAYAEFRDEAGLRAGMAELLDGLKVDDSDDLAERTAKVRDLVRATPLPDRLLTELRKEWSALVGKDEERPLAVRSSATAEDTASASFAGMNETFLNVCGFDQLVEAVRSCWASLFGARTVFYRAKRDFSQIDMDIAVVVQLQLESVAAGVMFTIDPATGEKDRLVIEGAFGLGESVVSGRVSPDRYVVDKSSLDVIERDVRPKEISIDFAPGGGTVERELGDDERLSPVLGDDEVKLVAGLGLQIEEHYGCAQDTEWARDASGKIWMLQARPVTASAAPLPGASSSAGAGEAEVLVRGLGAAPGRASGRARVIAELSDSSQLEEGEVLVAHMTEPDWVPLMRRASAIVTDSGGMTCHAAIVARELGVPCIVGTGDATRTLRTGELLGVDATRGTVVAGTIEPAAQPPAQAGSGATAPLVTGTKVLVNLSEPSQVERVSQMPVDGVGLLRAELMVTEALGGQHPRLLLEQERGGEFVDRMAGALLAFAQGFAPRPITYRTIDFRTNEFSGLEGGDRFEPQENNPMIGYRGAARYIEEPDAFRLELEAIRRVWDEGMDNFHVMLPFVRTAGELERCRALVAEAGLFDRRGFELWVMAEVPSVLFNLERYAEIGVAGISIGSNDLTQLLLGCDRDNEVLATTFDARDPAVTEYLSQLIPAAKALGLQTSICGQAPSIHPEYAEFLVGTGIDAISVTPDAVERTRANVAAAEQRLVLAAARAERARAANA